MAKAFAAAIRNLRRAPAFTALVVITLALGIGATTAMFSVVDAVLLRPLPYPGVERFSEIWTKTASNDTFPGIPETAVVRLREGLADLAMVEGYQMGSATITGGTEPDLVGAPTISPRLLTLVGATPYLGRLFTDDDVSSTTPVVIISYKLWSTNFGSAPDIIGRQVEIDDRPHTVIGVMSPRVRYPEANAAIWRPLNMAPSKPSRRRIMTVAVRNTTVTADQFAARLSSVAGDLAGAKLIAEGSTLYPDVLLQERFGRNSPRAFWTMFGAVVIVLLVACVNVSNLLMARASHHHGEFALRSALGASRSRLVVAALTECAMLVVFSGVAGIVVARVLLSVLLSILPRQLTYLSANASELDWRVMTFAVVVSAITCVIAGLAPSIRASRTDPLDALKTQSQTIAGRDQFWQNALLGTQLALVLVLLAGGGLLLKSFLRLSSVETGFVADHLNLLTVELPTRRYEKGGAALATLEDVERRLEAMGDMQATIAGGTPLTGPSITFNVTPEAEGGVAVDFSDQEMPWMDVAPDYFQTLGIPLIAGRTFAADDPQEEVIIINDKLASRYWGTPSPIGKRFRLQSKDPWMTVIGVAGDVRQLGMTDPTGHGMEFYRPLSRKQAGGYFALLVRSGRDPATVIALAKQALWTIDGKLPLVDAMPMAQQLDESLYRERFFLRLTTAFTVIATSLAMIGVYASFVYWVSRRRREVAIRIAVGASPRAVMQLILSRTVRLAVIGGIGGLALAVAGARVIESMLFEVDPRDPVTLIAVTILLAIVALAASLVPAIRAARIDPMTTLRAE